MTSLHHIHEAGILYNLGERSNLEDQRPYTFMVSFIRPTLGVDLKAMVVCDIKFTFGHPATLEGRDKRRGKAVFMNARGGARCVWRVPCDLSVRAQVISRARSLYSCSAPK